MCGLCHLHKERRNNHERRQGEIINGFRLVQGGMDALTPELEHRLIGYKTNAFGFSGLIREDDIEIAKDLMIARADIESIMLYNEKYVNEEAMK